MLPEVAGSIQRFRAEMANVDVVAQVLLKGHLLLEEAICRIMDQYVFHREHLADARLSFHQKALIARSLCLRKNRFGEWDLLNAINSLRNDLAHRLNSQEREKKLAAVKDIYAREAGEVWEGIKGSDALIVL